MRPSAAESPGPQISSCKRSDNLRPPPAPAAIRTAGESPTKQADSTRIHRFALRRATIAGHPADATPRTSSVRDCGTSRLRCGGVGRIDRAGVQIRCGPVSLIARVGLPDAHSHVEPKARPGKAKLILATDALLAGETAPVPQNFSTPKESLKETPSDAHRKPTGSAPRLQSPR